MVYNVVKSFPVNPDRTSLFLRLIKTRGLKNSVGYLEEGKKKGPSPEEGEETPDAFAEL